MTREARAHVHPREFTSGTRVGDFRLVRYVDEGGYGCVWLAESDENPGHRYAVKFALHADGRARREVRLQLLAEHPNVVRIVAHGCYPRPREGWPYLVMDWVEGGTLLAWARRANPSLRVVVGVFGKLALALQAAHERGVLHRDVKPTNVLVREVDGEPFLSDFGAGDASYATTLTREGALPPGSLPYRSPEALRFKGEQGYPYRPTDDWYALGVSFYEVLTEVAPFSLDVPPEHFIQEVVQRRPVHPAVLNPHVPRAVGDVVMRLLEKRPGRRLRDGHRVHAALQRALETEAAWEASLYAPQPPVPPEAAVTRPPTSGDGPAGADEEVKQAHVLKAWVSEDDARLNATLARRDALLAAEPTRAQRVRRQRAWGLAALMALVLIGVAVWNPRDVPPPAPALAVADAPPEPLVQPQAAAPVTAPLAPVQAIEAPRKRDETVKMMQSSAKTPEKPTAAFLQRCARLGWTTAAAVSLGCPSVPVRPPPADCPQGATQALRRLGIELGDNAPLKLDPAGGRAQDPIVLREGPIVSLITGGPLRDARVVGHVWFGAGERFYVRYTEAQLKGGTRIPICARGQEAEESGFPKSPSSTADNIRVAGNAGWIRFVGKFTE